MEVFLWMDLRSSLAVISRIASWAVVTRSTLAVSFDLYNLSLII